MNACDLLIRHTARRFDVAATFAELGGHNLHDFETLDALGMTWRSEMIGEMR